MTRKYYKFRIYPTKEQETILKKTIGCCRYVYNWGLSVRMNSYRKKGLKGVNFVGSVQMMGKLKRSGRADWLKETAYNAQVQSLKLLDNALIKFFDGTGPEPKPKLKKFNSSVKLPDEVFSFKNGVLKVCRIKKPIKIKISRDLPSKPKSCRIIKNDSDQWFAVFECVVDERFSCPQASGQIGIDLGIETFATFSDGVKIKRPSSIKRIRRKLEKFKRSHSRKKLRSKNREKARIKVARARQKIFNIQNDFQHKLSNSIVRENQTIAIEDLDIKGMTKNENPKLAGLIVAQGWIRFRKILKYKAGRSGRELVVVDRFFPSSKTCSCCGKPTTLTLKQRVWSCPCGATHDRDVNAARNILAAGIAASACGVDKTPVLNGGLTLKQESLEIFSKKSNYL